MPTTKSWEQSGLEPAVYIISLVKLYTCIILKRIKLNAEDWFGKQH